MSGLRNEDYRKSEDWLRFRAHWLQDNPPLDNGSYVCGICGGWVSVDEVTLDHVEPRTSETIFEQANIQPAHGYCNYRKGSRRLKPVVDKEQYEFLRMLSDI